jgi:serine/threonine protein kinase/tetratricopeptide (TPR) repeat protein
VASRTQSQQEKGLGQGTEEMLPGETALAVDPFIGRVLSHYRLEERLGAGGMGLLYRGTDLALGRAVAVKLLARHLVSDATAKARFVQEARAASALDHPNIANVHDIGEEDGELFIVMALYEGETLKQRLEKGRLPVDEAVGILRQVALGLEAAHRAGIVHRDIKPSNLLWTSSGTVKILDFGVAKLLGESQADMTQAGQPIGTVLYMSPEQVAGERVDARSDLWSLGVLAYEVLAGVSPFQAESSAATTKRILNDDPPSLATMPSVPGWFAELVSQLLRKNPAERPQSASELLKRLDKPVPSSPAMPNTFRPTAGRRSVLAALIGAIIALGAGGFYLYLHRGSPNKLRSLVVLPFVNVAANPDAEYLSDGIADGLINSLSQIPELRVIARTTAFRYKGKDLDFQTLGRQLCVDGVLSGRVQQVGDKLVIQADLVDTSTGSQLWGEQYNRPLTDALRIQEEITKAIAERLRPRLAPDVHNRVTRRYTDNSDAYQRYLRGRFFLTKYTKDGLTKSREYFQKAIELDPNYALAYSGLADSYTLGPQYAGDPAKEAYPQALRAALKALALDDQLAEAHVSFGLISSVTWDWTNMEKEFKRAVELSPNYPRAHHNYGLSFATMGRLDEALAETQLAQQLDPANVVTTSNVGRFYCQLGQYEPGIAAAKDALALDPSFMVAHWTLATCYLRQKKYPEAIAVLQEARSLRVSGPRILGLLAYAYAVSSNRNDAMRGVEELKSAAETDDDAPMWLAQVYVGLDDRERAFECLEKAYQRRAPWFRFLKTDFTFDPLHSDPRFRELLRRVGLPP